MDRTTGVFIDAENLIGGYGQRAAALEMSAVKAAVKHRLCGLGFVGRLLVCRAYASWAEPQLGWLRTQLRGIGIETVHVEGSNQRVKNAADIHLAVDALTCAYEMPSMTVVVLISGDGGLVPVVRQLQSLGRFVAGVANEGSASDMLKGACDDFLELAPARVQPHSPDERVAETPSVDDAVESEFGRVLVSVTAELLEGAESVALSQAFRAVRSRLGIQTLAEVLGRARPMGAAAEPLRRNGFALVRHPENPSAWLIVREGSALSERQSAPEESMGGPEFGVVPIFRSAVPGGVGAVSGRDEAPAAEGASWFRDADVGRVIVPTRLMD